MIEYICIVCLTIYNVYMSYVEFLWCALISLTFTDFLVFSCNLIDLNWLFGDFHWRSSISIDLRTRPINKPLINKPEGRLKMFSRQTCINKPTSQVSVSCGALLSGWTQAIIWPRIILPLTLDFNPTPEHRTQDQDQSIEKQKTTTWHALAQKRGGGYIHTYINIYVHT